MEVNEARQFKNVGAALLQVVAKLLMSVEMSPEVVRAVTVPVTSELSGPTEAIVIGSKEPATEKTPKVTGADCAPV